MGKQVWITHQASDVTNKPFKVTPTFVISFSSIYTEIMQKKIAIQSFN